MIFFVMSTTAVMAQMATTSIGFTAIAKGNMYKTQVGKSSTPACLFPGGLCSSNLPVYIFTGKGNWDEANNWQDNVIPPAVLPQGFEIIINPSGSNECVLNIPLQRISPGAKLTVVAGKKLRVQGVLDTK
ncbi:MAG TPA: hypothetical protein PKC39_02390 [Ferruginibacter sp.]|nr:hypothetical protein [Ferruginibacter sp.]HMP19784.1 hypothetical protein [Ferruginibacter sp.]